MNLKKLSKLFSICQLKEVPLPLLKHQFVFIANTDDEISLVCPTELAPSDNVTKDDGWVGFRIDAKLDFSLVGVLAELSSALSKLNISIFAVSTFNTDYIFIKEQTCKTAEAAFLNMGHTIVY